MMMRQCRKFSNDEFGDLLNLLLARIRDMLRDHLTGTHTHTQTFINTYPRLDMLGSQLLQVRVHDLTSSSGGSVEVYDEPLTSFAGVEELLLVGQLPVGAVAIPPPFLHLDVVAPVNRRTRREVAGRLDG